DKLFKSKPKSRAGYTISLLKDKQGKDAIICVNFAGNGGFALISAVKTHEPILAYSEEGNFNDVDSLKFPLNEWLKDAIDNVSSSIELPEDSLRKILSTWRIYEEPKSKLKSRVYDYGPDKSKFVNITYEEYLDLWHVMADYVNKWQAEGYRVYEIDEYNRDLSMGDKFQIAEYVQGNIYAQYTDDYWALTVVREKDYAYEYQDGSRFETKWGQERGYNQSFEYRYDDPSKPIYAGCGPIAVGQVMYHFKHPSFFNWDVMTKTDWANKVTSDFLLDVKNKCNATYTAGKGTGCSTDDRIKALKAYGYSCKKVSSVTPSNIYGHTPAIVASKLRRINDKGKEEDVYHAWTIECQKNWGSHTHVEIWTFLYPDEFKCIYQEDVDVYDTAAFYVNWGWYGKNDGFYSFSNNMKPYDEAYLKNTFRSAIVDIHPNR
ncbi:MAG: C10 family peptidase, partial [Muribaculaceae bacterium]|nr:C10 family peptidase [Muribaculaceae bacterium]